MKWIIAYIAAAVAFGVLDSFWLRWADTDLTPGADDGLSVDDFALTPSIPVVDSAPQVTATEPTNGATDVPIATNLGTALGAAMVMIGAYAKLTDAVSIGALRDAMAASMPPYRQKHVPSNIAMLEAGYAHFPHPSHAIWEAA